MKGLYGLALLLASSVSFSAVAATSWDDYGVYVGGDVGVAFGAVDADQMNRRMQAIGYDTSANVTDQNRRAWGINVGYRLNRLWDLQLGYRDLGEVRTRLSGNASDIQDYLNSANLVHPRSGSGYELSLLGRYPLSPRSYLYGRGGLLFADARYRAEDDSSFVLRNNSDQDIFFGGGYGYELSYKWGLRLSLDRYVVDGEKIPLAALSVLYKLHKTPQKPIPLPPVAPVPPVVPVVETAAQVPVTVLAAPVSMTLAITFDSDSSVIREEDLDEIAKLAEFMNHYSNTRVTLEGHTDDRGNDAYNKSLSTRRAQAAHDELIHRMGIAAERVAFVGYGEERPIETNATAEGRAANRRVMAEISNTP